MVLVGVLSSFGAPRGLWIVSGLAAILLAVFSGFVGALFARSSPLFNGALAGLVGAFSLLGLLSLVAPVEAHMAFVGPLLTVTFLAFCGAFFAVHVWPRHGL